MNQLINSLLPEQKENLDKIETTLIDTDVQVEEALKNTVIGTNLFLHFPYNDLASHR